MKQFEEFSAQSLYCPNCKQAVPVVKNIMLILPDGNLYNYICKKCGNSIGSQTDSGKSNPDFR